MRHAPDAVTFLCAGVALCVGVVLFVASGRAEAKTEAEVVIGSKVFTESYVLAEIAAQAVEHDLKVPVSRRLGMGNTGILFEALKGGAIDVYPDYTGTLTEAILKQPQLKDPQEIQAELGKIGLVMSGPLGFNNTYSMAVKASYAKAHDLHSIGDLAKVGDTIRVAFSYEFMDRRDGYQGMVDRYGLNFPSRQVARMEHNLTFQAMSDDAVDLIDVYSTDAKIKKFGLVLLADDRNYFPVYQAVWVARRGFVEEHANAWRVLTQLEGKITEERMRAMNAAAELDKRGFAQIAADFLGLEAPARESLMQKVWQRTREHLWLVGAALLFSLLVGIPLGIAAVRFHAAGQGILIGSAVVQTVPSLALLCFLIPVFGVGNKPALAALCLYSLLPVVLNTFTGVRGVDPRHLENARAFGLNKRQILFRIVLPLSSPTLLAGIKNATIVSIGTATLAALVGAGGYGAPIVSGLSLNDVPTILTGAVPAAVMALIAHGIFEVLGLMLIPRGLQQRG
jgi:osmoprotectant transport system permease protein